ncbi:hypothetical protein TELCIR_10902 [Teladorsagia circumcincta]|uniref:Uncharacterized protein n=1 Tax=Teladorsagia circumcincta TaxID=45464 RepID=A0A2G9UC94_TELCI|nr:hypothetical protein TELCIR_10902 [Teladorsagia circumcincta]
MLRPFDSEAHFKSSQRYISKSSGGLERKDFGSAHGSGIGCEKTSGVSNFMSADIRSPDVVTVPCFPTNPEIHKLGQGKQHVLAHEIGQGSLCRKCNCTGLDLHFWSQCNVGPDSNACNTTANPQEMA